MSERYHVVLEGKVRPEANREAVIPDLAALVGRDAGFARGLLSGQRVTLKSNVPRAEADEAVAELRRIGVLADVERAPDFQIDPDVDVRLHQRTRPALWNPDAGAAWSLIFTPVFGSFLHLRNWHALQQPDRIAGARRWFTLSLMVLVATFALSIVAPWTDNAVRGLNFVYLLLWYFASARAQVRHVKLEYGSDYVRKGWWRPLLLAVVLVVGTMIAAGAVQFMAGNVIVVNPSGTTRL